MNKVYEVLQEVFVDDKDDEYLVYRITEELRKRLATIPPPNQHRVLVIICSMPVDHVRGKQ